MTWAKVKQKITQWRGVFLVSTSVTGFVILLRFAGLLQQVELLTLDQLFRMRPLESPDNRVVIIGIGEEDIQTLGWPISDAILAKLIQKIQQQNPRVIGLDIFRDIPVEPGHTELLKVFESTPNLLGIEKVGQDDQGVAPPRSLKEKDQVAANNFPIDVDAKIRRTFVYLSGDEGSIFGLGFKSAWYYLVHENIEPEMLPDDIHIQLGGGLFAPLESNDGGYMREDTRGYQILLNYRGPQKNFPLVSLMDVIEERIDLKLMKDRLVLIGSTATSVKDSWFTPYGTSLFSTPESMYGVTIHANIASQFISAALDGRPSIKTWSELVETLWILAWSLLGSTVVCRWYYEEDKQKLAFFKTLLLLCLAICILGVTTYVSFLLSWWIPLFPPLLSLTLSTIGKTGYTLLKNLKISYQQIEEYAHTLEIKVEQRTHELKLKNEELEQTNDELEKTLEQLQTAQKQMIAQEKLAYLGSLTAGVAHEIRNPLNFVNNFAEVAVELTQEIIEEIEGQEDNLEEDSLELLKEDLKDLQESVADIEKNGKRIERIVHSMMMHSQTERGQREAIDINVLIDDAMKLAYHAHKNQGGVDIFWDRDYDKSLEKIKVIPQDMTRAFLNIINNACYAVHAKKKESNEEFQPIIVIKTLNIETYVKIIIRDNGSGIPPEIQEQIFNPFFTTKPTGEGTGLGLSITFDTIVGQHQGEISVNSEPGDYTEILIILPKNTEKTAQKLVK